MSSVDVFIPCYRYGRFLRECVESVLSQSLRQVRVLSTDDASPDNTAELAAELVAADPRVTFLRHAVNKGHIQTYSEGIEWTSATYSLLLSADDYLLPGSLERVAELMDAHPEVGLIFGSGVEVKSEVRLTDTFANAAIAKVLGNRKQRVLSGMVFFRLVEANEVRNIVPTPTVVVRTELQKRLGGYRAELPRTSDLELWLRLAAHSAVGVIAEYQAVTRMHGDNIQNQYYKANYLPDLQQQRAARYDQPLGRFSQGISWRGLEPWGWASRSGSCTRSGIWRRACGEQPTRRSGNRLP